MLMAGDKHQDYSQSFGVQGNFPGNWWQSAVGAIDGMSRTGAEAGAFWCQNVAVVAAAATVASIDIETRSEIASKRLTMRYGHGRRYQQ